MGQTENTAGSWKTSRVRVREGGHCIHLMGRAQREVEKKGGQDLELQSSQNLYRARSVNGKAQLGLACR